MKKKFNIFLPKTMIKCLFDEKKKKKHNYRPYLVERLKKKIESEEKKMQQTT